MNKKRIKWDIKKAKKLFKDNGCKLLEEEYINSRTKMKYICTCNREAEICLSHFRGGKRCKKCMGEKSSIRQRKTMKEVKKIFKDGGCCLLETVYKNNKTKMWFICSCDRLAQICLSHFQNGVRCKECGIERNSEKLRYTIEEVKEIFKKGGCELLETVYKNARTKMKYLCECDRTAEISLCNFMKGKRCMKCSIEKRSGKNASNYNFNKTDEEREIERHYHEYDQWRKDVYKRDNYSCVICGDDKGGNLVAHHLEGYTPNRELRTVVSNGVTMDEDCYKLFHKLYGYGNNTAAQFYEFQEHQKMVEYQKILNIEV